MPRSLAFQFGDRERSFAMSKLDRSKLYGSKKLEVLDDQDEPCDLVTLAEDGRTLIGSGGTGIGHLTADGEWCEKSDLTPVDLEGQHIESVASSFDEPIQLFEMASPEELLDHDIRLVYRLDTDDDIEDLKAELERGTIFSFPFSYRGGLQADAGFLTLGNDGEVFMLVGDRTELEWIGLPQTASVADDEATAIEPKELMDFDMI